MQDKLITLHVFGWLFGAAVVVVGVLNILLIHPVPGVVYLLLSLLYLPPANVMFKNRFNLSIPLVVKILLGIFIILFTLGVSDLGDMID